MVKFGEALDAAKNPSYLSPPSTAAEPSDPYLDYNGLKVLIEGMRNRQDRITKFRKSSPRLKGERTVAERSRQRAKRAVEGVALAGVCVGGGGRGGEAAARRKGVP